MHIGLLTNFWGKGGGLEEQVEDALLAERQGFATYWVEQPPLSGSDALTCLAVIGRRTNTIQLGVRVVPTLPRHPVVMCQQALTTQIACGGRLSLGVGPSHAKFMEEMYGLSYDHPARRTAEYLRVLRPLLHGKAVDFSGEFYRVNIPSGIKVDGQTPETALRIAPPPVVLAAMGPMMLEIAGELADGVVPGVVTGPDLIENYFVPRLRRSAGAAGRPVPRLIASLPAALVPRSQKDAAHEAIQAKVGKLGMLPSYKRMLDLQGIEGPAQISLVGDETEILAGLRRLADAGLDEYQGMCVQVDAETGPRTQAFLADVARQGSF